MRRNEYILRAIALVLILWGVYKFVSQARGTWLTVRHGLSDPKFLWFHMLFLLVAVVIPLITIISGWGLLKLRPWAHLLAIGISVLMFILSFCETIYFLVQRYYAGNVPVPEIPEGTIVGYYSMWPTYITVVVSGVLILILWWRPIRNLFAEKGFA
jgi:hypothetical protein